MALKVKKLETPFGLTLENVYFRLNIVSYVDNAEILKYKGVFYVNEDIRNTDKLKSIGGLEFEGYMRVNNSDIKTSNLFELCYEHIKNYAKELDQFLKTCEEEENPCLNLGYLMFLDAEDC